eukprot:591543-Amphidinium_carterae.1
MTAVSGADDDDACGATDQMSHTVAAKFGQVTSSFQPLKSAMCFYGWFHLEISESCFMQPTFVPRRPVENMPFLLTTMSKDL